MNKDSFPTDNKRLCIDTPALYNLVPCKEHINHHKNPDTNYGIEIYDILFNTKNKNDVSVENYNHYSINLIIITILYCMIYKLKF